MKKAMNNDSLIDLIDNSVQLNLDKTLKSIGEKVQVFPELEKVFLDFILIPTNSVEDFNNTMDNLI